MEKRVRLLGVEASVNAKIESIDSFSAHADYNNLISWLENFKPKPKKVFLVHGEEKQMLPFAKKIQELGLNSYTPSYGEVIEI